MPKNRFFANIIYGGRNGIQLQNFDWIWAGLYSSHPAQYNQKQ